MENEKPFGRPPFEPTDAERKQVESMSGFGVPISQISSLIRDGIDDDTLKKHFKSELINGKAKANSQIGQTLFQKAKGGDTSAMIWWSKTQMGWKETVLNEHTGANGGAIQHTITGLRLTPLTQDGDD